MTDAIPFANRLTKNLKHWRKWARRQGIGCFRVYDRDIPEFPLAIDVYEGRPHIQTFATRWDASPEEEDAWEQAVRETVARVFETDPATLAFKTRRRQKGTAQYEKTGIQGEDFVVEETGLKFWVNLHAYLDTGLFLDHRITRGMVRERAAGKRMLNLFAYTGSFSVYAAAGGARESLTVDLSNTYQDWSRRNFELNGMDLTRHRLERADVMDWLEQASRRRERFDLIVLDPPSFSNSKMMEGTLDVQRDHPWMINRCLTLLAPGGELFFSNNRRGFKLYEGEIATTNLEEITHRTVPEDFHRGKPHRCWIIRAGG